MKRLRHPIRAIREPFGTAGLIVAVVALIAALGGSAIAAGALSGPEKKEIKKYAKKYAQQFAVQGPAGPAGSKGDTGAKGDPGAPGSKGDPGEKGTNGTNGTNGTDGVDGEDGMCSSTNPECVLPSGATMTGIWSFDAPTGGEELWSTISFPLQAVPAPIYGLGTVVYIGTESDQERVDHGAPPYDRVHCPGSAEDPQALPGYLCIYESYTANIIAFGTIREPTFGSQPDINSGIQMAWEINNNAQPAAGFGSWAFTAE